MSYCPHCGAKLPPDAGFCTSCGKPVQPQAEETVHTVDRSTKDKEDRWLITLLLCVCLGGFGVHRFYTGNTTSGIIMLLTLGGCGIWVIIDIIMIACNTYTDGNGLTLK
jgi:hypothetical protein